MMISGADWNTLLTDYALDRNKSYPGIGKVGYSNGRRYLAVRGKVLSHEQILQMTEERVKPLCELDSVKKTQSAFTLYVQSLEKFQKETILPSLQTYSARFSDWANKNFKFALVLSILTLGLLFKVWNDGNILIQKAETHQKRIINAQAFAKRLEEKITELQKVENISSSSSRWDCLPEDIMGIVFNLLPAEDRLALEKCDKAKEIMKKAQGSWNKSRIGMIENYQTTIIAALESFNNPEYAPIIEQIRKLKEDLVDKELPPWYLTRKDQTKKESFLGFPFGIVEIRKLKKGETIDREVPPWLNESAPIKNVRIMSLDFDKAEEYVARSILNILDQLDGFRVENPTPKFTNLFTNRAIFALAIRFIWEPLQWAPEVFRNDKNLMLKAVKTNRETVFFKPFPDALKNDEEFVLEAVKTNGHNLEFVSEELKNNETIVLEAIKNNGYSLKHASDLLKDNREIALTAVKKWGWALQFVSERLKKDREIVFEAVNQWCESIQFAPSPFRDDKAIIMAALNQEKAPTAWGYASKRIKADKEVFKLFVRQGLSLIAGTNEQKDDKEIVLEAIKKRKHQYNHASDRLKNDPEVLAAYQARGND